MKRMIWLGLPVIALTGCAGPGYVHETYHEAPYYGARPYYGQDVYIQRETYYQPHYEPRPRVVVVEPTRTIVVRQPEHRHVEYHRVDQDQHHERHNDRHEIRHPPSHPSTQRTEQRHERREDSPQRRDVAVRPIRVEREHGRQSDPAQRLGAQPPVSQDGPRRDSRRDHDEAPEQRPH